MLHDFQIQVFFFIVAAVKPSIPNGLTTDFNKSNPDFNNGAKNFKNPPFCILVNCDFENLISADVWLLNASLKLKICPIS